MVLDTINGRRCTTCEAAVALFKDAVGPIEVVAVRPKQKRPV